MAEMYKLPGSSYEELTKIIRAYASICKNGNAVTLSELAQSSGMDRTIISRNNGFLAQVKLVSEGSKKTPTALCIKLGRAYQLNIPEQIFNCWNEIIKSDQFLNRMISVIQIKGNMTKGDFINHIVYSSSNNASNNTRAGAAAIIEILKLTHFIIEQDGRISIGTQNAEQTEKMEQKHSDFETPPVIDIKKDDTLAKENQNLEKGYYVQAYTCETGKSAKFIIPEDATEDDLLAFYDMLKIVLTRKFKIKMAQ